MREVKTWMAAGVGLLTGAMAASADLGVLRDAAALPDADEAPAARLSADEEHAFPSQRAFRTLLHWSNPKSPRHISEDQALPFMKEIGINHCWGWPPDQPAPEWLNKIHLVNLTHKMGHARGEAEWFYVYLHTDWKRQEGDALSFDLLDRYYPKRFVIPKRTDPDVTFYVEDRENRAFLPASAFAADRATARLTVTGGEPGKEYRVLFLAGNRGVPQHFRLDLDDPKVAIPDATVPTVRARRLGRLEKILSSYPDVAVIRPTSEIYDRLNKVGDPDDDRAGGRYYLSRQSYWQTVHPARLARFEALTGRPFDPRWIVDAGYGENGYVPSEGLMQWVDLVRNDMGRFARQRNNLVHDYGKRVRLFFGDNFVGVEPYLGDIEHNGYDELVMSMDNGPGSVRFITGYPGGSRRIARFQWSGTRLPADEYAVQYRVCWRWMKREALFDCMDGLTLGGVGTKAVEIPELKRETERIFADFKTVYNRVHGHQAFRHAGFNVYILSTWGRMRSWLVFDHYLSQRGFMRHLVDLPVNVRWLSYREVLESGIPEDAAAVMLNGEPGSSWAGGPVWGNEKLTDSIRQFVRGGGGLLTIGAPTLVDGAFALVDVLGLRYAGAPNVECGEQLWSPTRWAKGGRVPSEYPKGGVMPLAMIRPNLYDLPGELKGRFDDQGDAWTIRFPANVETDGATLLAYEDFDDVGDGGEAWRFLYFKERAVESTRTGAAIHDVGKGRSVFIGGWSTSPEYLSLLKPLLFYAAGRTADLDRLNSGDPQVAVYFYPGTNMLIAYNHTARSKTTSVRFDPALAGIDAGTVRLRSLDRANLSVAGTVNEMRAGFPVELSAGEAAYWTVE